MNQWITLLGSIILGSYVILLSLNLNFRMTSASSDNISGNFNQVNLINLGYTLDYDFYKIGYGVTSGKISLADSNSITFRADLDNNNTIDSIRYSTTNLSGSQVVQNQRLKILQRRVNSQNAEMIATISDFKLTYYDSTGSSIAYSSLATQTNRDKIKTIRVYILSEAADSTSNRYSPLELQKVYYPKNL